MFLLETKPDHALQRIQSLHCDCGWGGRGYPGAQGGGAPTTYQSIVVEFYAPKLRTSFLNPNAKCPVCAASVYFYANSYGSRVFFDSVGPPWPKHPCTDRARITKEYLADVRHGEIMAQYEVRSAGTKHTPSMDRGEWKAFRVLRTRSFRLELEHLATGKRFETNLIKDTLPTLPETIWVRGVRPLNAEMSYFDEAQFDTVTHIRAAFDARKYATITEWLPFQVWFRSI